MGYLLRVRLASFFAGAASASAVGFFFLYKDYRIAQEAIARQVNVVHESLDYRIKALEKIKEAESAAQLDATE